MEHEPTAGELANAIAELSRRLDRIDVALARDYARTDLYAANRAADLAETQYAETRVAAVEERLTWVSRAAITGLVLPIVVGISVAIFLIVSNLSNK